MDPPCRHLPGNVPRLQKVFTTPSWLAESGGGDLGRRLRRQSEPQTVDQQLQLGLGLSVTRQHDLAAVGGRQMNVDHLNGGKFFQCAACCESRRQRVQPARQGDLQGVGEEGDEDVRLDPLFVLVEDRPDREVALQVLERLFDCDELNVVLPEDRRILVGQIGAQQIAPFTTPRAPQLLAIE
jgi:hypothetical protein